MKPGIWSKLTSPVTPSAERSRTARGRATGLKLSTSCQKSSEVTARREAPQSPFAVTNVLSVPEDPSSTHQVGCEALLSSQMPVRERSQGQGDTFAQRDVQTIDEGSKTGAVDCLSTASTSASDPEPPLEA